MSGYFKLWFFSLQKYVLAIKLATEGNISAFQMLAVLLVAMDLQTDFKVL